MFETIEMAPRDAILGLTETFHQDSNPEKINLSVGVYQDAEGKTPVLDSVKRAESRLVTLETSKSYLPIDGRPDFARDLQLLLFGQESELVERGLCATSQTPGGTGALRVAGDFMKRVMPTAKLWLSQPTWPNHPSVFAAAGIELAHYPYFNPQKNTLAFGEMLDALKKIPAGDVVLLHACCHNPTGADPTPDEWNQIAAVIRERGILPLVDFAYQGFAEGLREDAAALQALCQAGTEALVCSSFSKNFGLYRERVGGLTIVAGSADNAVKAQSQIKACIRASYSNPPSHGAAIVTTILADEELRDLWERELKAMRDRINGMRRLFVETLAAKGAAGDYRFINNQRGMFSFSGLLPDQVDRLRDECSIYIVGSGRINVAGMTERNMDQLCSAIAAVL